MIRSLWLRTLFDLTRCRRDRRRLAARSRKPVRLLLEPLEDRITPSDFQTLYSFTGGSDGMNPRASVIADSSGNLYGTTNSGGANGVGNVFQYSPSSGKVTALQSFSSTTEQNPLTGLIQDSSGYLYGTTTTGGTGGEGTVFRVNSDGTAFTVLRSFGISDGSDPQGGLTIDGKGNIYGTTSSGGTSNDGTVFELSPNGSGGYNFSTLHNFTGSNDGRQPDSSLLLDNQGNLYGVTQVGGTTTDGTVFELSPNGSGGYNFTTLHVFTGSDGFYPHSNLIMDGKGNLYGTTLQGGSINDGTVYELSPNGSGSYTLTTIHTFNGADGELPGGNWLMDSRGNFFGATLADGYTSSGTVYELSPTGSGGYNLATLHLFKRTDGASPWGGVTADSSGNLYGTTYKGGTSSDGTIFEITGVLNTFATTTSASNVTAAFSTNTQNVTLTATAHNGVGSDSTQSFTLTANPAPAPSSPRPPVLDVPPLLALFDSLLGGTETVNANGTETITYSLFGITLMVATYDGSGNFVGATLLGFNVPNWVWSL